MDSAEGLACVGLTNMLFMPYFGYSVQVNMYAKKLLVSFHRGCLWLDQPYPMDVEFISRITSLPNEGDNPMPYLAKKDVKPIK